MILKTALTSQRDEERIELKFGDMGNWEVCADGRLTILGFVACKFTIRLAQRRNLRLGWQATFGCCLRKRSDSGRY